MQSKLTFMLLLLAGLAGCQATSFQEMSYTERKALVSKMIDRCLAQGIPLKSREMLPCAEAEFGREMALRERNRMRASNALEGFATGMAAYGNSLQAGAASYNANRPINCTSRPGMNGVVRTNCY